MRPASPPDTAPSPLARYSPNSGDSLGSHLDWPGRACRVISAACWGAATAALARPRTTARTPIDRRIRSRNRAMTGCLLVRTSTAWRSGAARQFGDILGEDLRRELQALDSREIGEDRFGKLPDRQAAPDSKRRRLDAVGTFRRQDVCTEE